MKRAPRRGPLALLHPLLRPAFKRVGDGAAAGLQRALQRMPAAR